MEKKIGLFLFACFFGNFFRKKTANSKQLSNIACQILFLLFPWLKHLPVCKKQCPCLIVGSLSLTDEQLEKLLKGGSGHLVLLEHPGLQQIKPGQGRQRRVGVRKERWWAQRVRVKGWAGLEGGLGGESGCEVLPGLLWAVGAAACSQESRRGLLSLLLLPTSSFCEALEIAGGGDLVCHCWTREALW